MTKLNDYWNTEANKKVVFVRARKDNEKLHYIGYVTKWNLEFNHKIQITSWLLRFGGYKEIRYYNAKTKKCVGRWNLEKLDNYCKEKGINDFVWKDGNYLTLVEVKKEKFNIEKEKKMENYTGRFRQKVKETKREEHKEETLREYLDRIHVDSGSDAGFIIQEIGKSTEMQVSRRYIECAAWEYLLDMKIVDFEYATTIYGQQTIKLYLE